MKQVKLFFVGIICCLIVSCHYEEIEEQTQDSSSANYYSGCGRLLPGEYLNRGESIFSCNGKATLVHQKEDGHVVLYGPNGFIWATWVYNQPTSRLIMQTDGNLVLYNEGQPLWSSGTWGKLGAFLAIQDDCNMVIYYNNQAVWAASWNNPHWKSCAENTSGNTPPPDSIDVLSYLIDSSALGNKQTLQASNDYNQVSKLKVDHTNKRFWYMKQRLDSGQRWEQYRWDNSFIYLEKDTTLPAEFNAEAYITNPSLKLAKRYWKVGEKIIDSTYVKHFNFKNNSNNCVILDGNGVYWPYKRTLKARLANADIGGDLTNIDVIIIQVEMPDEDEPGYNYWNPPNIERHWYAKGYGFVRWQEWDGKQRSDGSWEKKNPDVDAPLHDVRFNKISNTDAPAFKNVCSSL